MSVLSILLIASSIGAVTYTQVDIPTGIVGFINCVLS
jgi:hypothetical protein